MDLLTRSRFTRNCVTRSSVTRDSNLFPILYNPLWKLSNQKSFRFEFILFPRFSKSTLIEIDNLKYTQKFRGLISNRSGSAVVNYKGYQSEYMTDFSHEIQRGMKLDKMNIESEEFWVNGQRHNLLGPAVVLFSNSFKTKREEYWLQGKRHRDNGPAIIEYYSDFWFGYYAFNNNALPKKEEEYWVNGKRHRCEAPARILYSSNGDNPKTNEEFWFEDTHVFEVVFVEQLFSVSGRSWKPLGISKVYAPEHIKWYSKIFDYYSRISEIEDEKLFGE